MQPTSADLRAQLARHHVSKTIAYTVRCIAAFSFSFVLVVATVPNSSADEGRYSIDEQLLLFCEEGRLVDRGLALSPFFGSMDYWIIKLCSNDLDFRAAMEITIDQLAALEKGASAGSHNPHGHDGRWIELDLSVPNCRDLLIESLSDKQLKQTQAVLLNLEGLMALRREQIGNQIGLTYDQQVEIASLANRSWTERASLLHQEIFTLQGARVVDEPKVKVQLRNVATELDHAILQLLSDDIKVKLLPLIKEARSWDDLMRRPR